VAPVTRAIEWLISGSLVKEKAEPVSEDRLDIFELFRYVLAGY
jgi:hypothetical protein